MTEPLPKPHTIDLPIRLNRLVEAGNPSLWRVHVNGRPSQLLIRKGPKPRYRQPQTWELVDERYPDKVIMIHNGPRHCLDTVRKLLLVALAPIIDTAERA